MVDLVGATRTDPLEKLVWVNRKDSTEQKIRILREAEGSGKKTQDVCRDHQISEQTFYPLKREFGMLEISQAKQLKEPQRENTRLKRMLAEGMPVGDGSVFYRIVEQ